MTVVFSSISSTQQATWQWRQIQGSRYLQCRLLEDFPHGFFTRHFVNDSLDELTKILATDATVYRTKQVHGKRIVTPSEITPATTKPVEADGLYSDGKKQALWVASADCTPALIADVKTQKVAAVHAGWRGTALSILPCAIARFLDHNSQLSDLRVALGPAISGEVYQVDVPVAVQVGSSLFPEAANLSSEAILDQLWQTEVSPLLPDPEPEKVRLDVRCVNTLQLEKMGLHSEQIAVAPHCTYQEPEDFFSYRRSGEKAVQWSGIVSTV
ncbi:MAG: peptidoglycan editing factor PgeF [Halothece sp. Uz-M2-17]|nr:peptidoglycan editing factor PgeF [Halothece sp. Uz-M2-17]